mgnify:CR=1 FL=1
MERLMALAKEQTDQIELYALDQTSNHVEFEAGKLIDIQSTIESGVTMRLIKDGKLGFAYTRNLNDRESLVRNARDSLKGGVEVRFDFPAPMKMSMVHDHDDRIKEASNTVITDECRRIYGWLQDKVKGQVDVNASTGTSRLRIMNSAGIDVTQDSSYYGITVNILYPGTAAGIHRTLTFKKFEPVDEEFLESILRLYGSGEKEVTTRAGAMQALFMPETMYTFIWRLQSATSGESLCNRQSPLADSLGEAIIDEKLTITNDPLDETIPGARAFDDEGVACRRINIVEKGSLMSFYYDLYYAARMNTEPSGHGFKTSRWGGDPVTMKPAPALTHVTIEPGNTGFWNLVRRMDRGVIVCGVLGAHSGNIPNGDFSVGICPGLYVEKGEIIGRIKNAMIAGNIYSVMKRVIDIEDRTHAAYTGYYPAVLFDSMNVATES